MCVGSARSLCVGERPIIDAVLAGLSEFIDPPMTSRITIAPDERLWIARRVADEVMGRAAAVLQLQLGNLVAPANAYFRAANQMPVLRPDCQVASKMPLISRCWSLALV